MFLRMFRDVRECIWVRKVLRLYDRFSESREGYTCFELFEEAYCEVYGCDAVHFDMNDWFLTLCPRAKRIYEKWEQI